MRFFFLNKILKYSRGRESQAGKAGQRGLQFGIMGTAVRQVPEIAKKHLCHTQIFLDHQHDYYYYAKFISVGNKIISIHLNARARGHIYQL